MANGTRNVSRRGFLGGTVAAAAGTAAATLLPRSAFAGGGGQKPALGLDALRPSGALDEAYWWKVRSQFNLVDGLTFMNNGTEGPVPRVVTEANDRYFREIAEDPTNNYRMEDVDEVRKKMAAFVGADPMEIALTRSTTEGMNIFARGLDWKEGDEVLIGTHEHGGGIGPYKQLEARYKIKIVSVPFPAPPDSPEQLVALYDKAFTPRTKVLMVSHITYVTGLVTPIKELAQLAHSKGALISVDGAHPLGMLDLNLASYGIDHYSAAGQKWLLCGTGTGMCYVKRDVQERVWPLFGAPGDPKTGARKYEAFGQRDVPDALGMAASIDFMSTIGKKNIEDRVRFLSSRFRAGLKNIPGVKMWTSEDPRMSAGLTLFSVGNIPMADVQKAIWNHSRIYIRTMGTGNLNGCCAATHLYNMPEEVDRLLDTIKWVSTTGGKTTSTAM